MNSIKKEKIKMNYVLGFLFSGDFRYVILIKKNKPLWQKGLLNGVGGKIESFDASPDAAMEREFEEETGVKTNSWLHFAKIVEPGGFIVHCYTLIDNVSLLNVTTTTDEIVEKVKISDIVNGELPSVNNLWWLIPLAINSLTSKKYKLNTTIEYTPKINF